jgi:hypothetical protein
VLLSRFLAAEGSGDARRRLCTTALALSVARSTVVAEPLSLARQASAFVPVLLAGLAALAAGVTAGFSAAGAAAPALAVLLPAGKNSAMAEAAAMEALMLTPDSGAASLLRLRFAAVVDAALKTSSKSDCGVGTRMGVRSSSCTTLSPAPIFVSKQVGIWSGQIAMQSTTNCTPEAYWTPA